MHIININIDNITYCESRPHGSKYVITTFSGDSVVSIVTEAKEYEKIRDFMTLGGANKIISFMEIDDNGIYKLI